MLQSWQAGFLYGNRCIHVKDDEQRFIQFVDTLEELPVDGNMLFVVYLSCGIWLPPCMVCLLQCRYQEYTNPVTPMCNTCIVNEHISFLRRLTSIE